MLSRVVDGTRFLGYRVFPHHRLLARENVIRMKRRLKRLQVGFADGSISAPEIRQRLMSWLGHALHADTFHLRERLFRETKFVRRAE